MRLQNTPAKQALADKKAQEGEFFLFADYVGINDAKLVYQAMHEDSEPRCEGFPILILIDAEGNVSETVGLEGLEIINEMRHRDYRKGREIFRRYKKALEDHEPLKKSERDYYFEIVRMVDGIGYDCPVNATTVYQFLEAAERLGMRLEFRPEPFVMDRLDGWEYYIALVKKRKSSR